MKIILATEGSKPIGASRLLSLINLLGLLLFSFVVGWLLFGLVVLCVWCFRALEPLPLCTRLDPSCVVSGTRFLCFGYIICNYPLKSQYTSYLTKRKKKKLICFTFKSQTLVTKITNHLKLFLYTIKIITIIIVYNFFLVIAFAITTKVFLQY